MDENLKARLRRYAPMTTKQLREVALLYAAEFPDWQIYKDRTAFFRTAGPVRQMIWFQAMSSASYRPMHGISSLVLPDAHIRMLPQLPVGPRTVTHSSHSHRWPEMLEAMGRQFHPNIRNPLNLPEVLALCSSEARPDSANDLSMLAILNAWLGRWSDAIDCCMRIQTCPFPTLAPVMEWEQAMRLFGRELAKAIEMGVACEFLVTSMTAKMQRHA